MKLFIANLSDEPASVRVATDPLSGASIRLAPGAQRIVRGLGGSDELTPREADYALVDLQIQGARAFAPGASGIFYSSDPIPGLPWPAREE